MLPKRLWSANSNPAKLADELTMKSILTLETLEDRITPATVGYWDMEALGGKATQVPPILAAGHTPVELTDLTETDLEGVDVLLVQNPSNGRYRSNFVNVLPDIHAAVANGMVLVLHDRYVDPAETILPGGENFDIIRNFDDRMDIDVLDDTTVLTDGPGGVIENDTLDNGDNSSHGYSVAGSLPPDARQLLSTSTPEHVVTFSYRYGEGSVVYSTIPLDFHLDRTTKAPNFSQIYAPNVVAYGVSLLNAPPVAQPSTVETTEDGVIEGVLQANDPNDDPLTFTIVDGPTHGQVTLTDPDQGLFTYTPNPNFHGEDSFTFTASDGQYNSAVATVTLLVSSVNDVPQVEAGPDQAAIEGEDVNFLGIATDVEDDPLTYLWDFGDGNTATGPTASHAYADNGDYTVTLTVEDDQGGISSATLLVTVANAAPVVSLTGPSAGVVGESLSFTGSFQDGGTADTWSTAWQVLDSGGIQVSGGTDEQWTFTPTEAGSYTVVFTVTDDDGGVGTETLTLDVDADVEGVLLLPNPFDPAQVDLVVNGTSGNDVIFFRHIRRTQEVAVYLNGDYLGRYQPTGRLVVHGHEGHDVIFQFGRGHLSSWFFGGAGNDLLVGGSQSDVLVGEEGNDWLFGKRGRDLLFGGLGRDVLVGGRGQDLQVGGSTAYDDNHEALHALQSEWTSKRGYRQRLANVTGGTNRRDPSSDRLNGEYFLRTEGEGQTVFDDGARDWFLFASRRDLSLGHRKDRGCWWWW